MKSFEKVPNWLQDIQRYKYDGKSAVILVGNKMDAIREVPTDVILKFAKEHSLPYVETR